MAEPSRPVLAAAVPLAPDIAGQHRYLLECSCGQETDLTFEKFSVKSGRMAYTCRGCGTGHRFPVAARYGAEDGGSEEGEARDG